MANSESRKRGALAKGSDLDENANTRKTCVLTAKEIREKNEAVNRN